MTRPSVPEISKWELREATIIPAISGFVSIPIFVDLDLLSARGQPGESPANQGNLLVNQGTFLANQENFAANLGGRANKARGTILANPGTIVANQGNLLVDQGNARREEVVTSNSELQRTHQFCS